MKRRAATVAVLLMAAIAAAGILRLGAAARERQSFEALRDSVRTLRTQAETCTQQVQRGEAGLATFRAQLDTLHDRVRAFESARNRVPQSVYDAYLDEFEAYQAVSGTWEDSVAAVEQRLAACRSVADAHNTAAAALGQRLLDRRN